jgi:hypothetical protein
VKVPAGKYELKIEGDVFYVYRKRVRVEVGKTESLSVTLLPQRSGGMIKIR